MRSAFDTHVHLHPFYDLARAFAGARAVLSAAAGPGGAAGLCLTEAAGCDAFGALRDGRWTVPGWTVVPAADDLTLRLDPAARGEGLWILAGRQIVTRERVEVLGLGLRAAVPEQLDETDTVERIRAAGGLAVLPWAPGKWFGRRGRLVASLMDRFGPDAVALADTTLRPVGWPTPTLIRRARREGFRVFAGSDPLPFAGEEMRIGSLATVVDGIPDAASPGRSILRRIGSPALSAHIRGSRPGPIETAIRLRRHAQAKRA